MYRAMKTGRYFEERMESVNIEGKHPVFCFEAEPISGEMHLSNGQESAAAGMIVHLTKNDAVYATHQPHYHAIAKGVDLAKMTAEIYGKKSGFKKEIDGHMHLLDSDVNFSCGGFVSAGIEHAVDTALANKKKRTNDVVVAFINEGASNSGAFNESLNLAVLWKLPIILVIEDNGWGIAVAQKYAAAPTNVLRATAHGIKGYLVKDNDPLEMYSVSKQAVESARKGEGPSIIDIKTYQYLDHSQGDTESDHVSDDVAGLRAKDPVKRLRNHLLFEDLINYEDIDLLDSEARKVVDKAYEFAIQSEFDEIEPCS